MIEHLRESKDAKPGDMISSMFEFGDDLFEDYSREALKELSSIRIRDVYGAGEQLGSFAGGALGRKTVISVVASISGSSPIRNYEFKLFDLFCYYRLIMLHFILLYYCFIIEEDKFLRLTLADRIRNSWTSVYSFENLKKHVMDRVVESLRSDRWSHVGFIDTDPIRSKNSDIYMLYDDSIVSGMGFYSGIKAEVEKFNSKYKDVIGSSF
ncbi:hypothetical protein [Rubrivirga sp. IMCC45206]|uniref:hypothetical protein n=1 Tax=Rubrivirga sp. IMCC45206 TaxID=3391614 RepID=UPI0039903292